MWRNFVTHRIILILRMTKLRLRSLQMVCSGSMAEMTLEVISKLYLCFHDIRRRRFGFTDGSL
jgi:hypothetical protein